MLCSSSPFPVVGQSAIVDIVRVFRLGTYWPGRADPEGVEGHAVQTEGEEMPGQRDFSFLVH